MDITSLANNIVNQFIVKPNTSVGINGFVFAVVGDEDAMLDADITDHFVEGNYAIQDHIALRPPRFTLTGYVGELNDILQVSFLNVLTTVQSLGAIDAYTPSFSAQATQVYNKISNVASRGAVILNQVTNMFQTFTGLNTTASKQQEAYNYFVNLWMSRVLCSVETPWAVWKNMAIESIRILQKDSNKFITEFAITFKQIRTVTTKSYTPLNFAVNGAEGIQQVFEDGRAADSNIPASFTAGAITGQSTLDDGTPVTTDVLSSKFSLPTLAELAGGV